MWPSAAIALEANEAQRHQMYALAHELHAASLNDRLLFIMPTRVTRANEARIVNALTALSKDTKRVSYWCHEKQSVEEQKRALLSFAYITKAWKMLAPCKRTPKGLITSCAGTPQKVASLLNSIFGEVVGAMEALNRDGLFERDTMDTSTLFGAELSGSQSGWGWRLNRNRRVGHALLTTMIQLDAHVGKHSASKSAAKRAVELATELKKNPKPSEYEVSGWKREPTGPPTPPPTPLQRHIVPVNAPRCTHVTCAMMYRGNRLVMRVHHHHLERHGKYHFCSISRGQGDCTCKCHGGAVELPKKAPEMEPWYKPRVAGAKAKPLLVKPEFVRV